MLAFSFCCATAPVSWKQLTANNTTTIERWVPHVLPLAAAIVKDVDLGWPLDTCASTAELMMVASWLTAHCHCTAAKVWPRGQNWEQKFETQGRVNDRFCEKAERDDGGVRVEVVGTTRALPSLPHCGTAQLMLDAVYEICAPSPTWHADE